ncbi:MAG: hypothetical protein ACM3VZ_10380 [Acidobacteriota bacterium]
MTQLRLKFWVALALVASVGACGGGGDEPAPLGGPVIHSDSVPQSFPVDAPVSVQMTQWQRIDLTMTEGNSLTMTVNATGAPPLVYSWRLNNRVIDGQDGHMFVIPRVRAGLVKDGGSEGDYTVTVANASNIVVSQALRLRVVPKVIGNGS